MRLTAETKGILSITVVIALVVSGLFIINNSRADIAKDTGLPAFQSEQQLFTYLNAHSASGGSNMITIGDMETASSSGSGTYTKTNVQVDGVDELDFIETDGELVYLASTDRIDIVRVTSEGAMANVSVILVSQLVQGTANSYEYIQGIFLTDNGLVVVLNVYDYSDCNGVMYIGCIYPQQVRTMICLVDVSEPSFPHIVGSCGISGYLLSARVHDGVVYVLAQQSIWSSDDLVMPMVWNNAISANEPVSSIRYDPNSSKISAFTNILAYDIAARESNTTTLLMGYGSVTYATGENIYVTSTVYGDDLATGSMLRSSYTNIFRLHLDGLSVLPNGLAQVSGCPLNQFSLDEQDGYLRIATSSIWQPLENMVFVLDPDMQVVGELRGIAMSESIRSARFMNDTLYLVTFFQTDPLFVIDLSDPTNPQIRGELVMPGFSNYLHLIGNDLLIGVGVENGTLKVSMYDVSDPAHPTVLVNLVAMEWTWSEAEWNHHAFMYDAASGTIGIPMTTYGQSIQQGAQIYKVDGRNLTFEGSLSTDGSSRCMMIGGTLYTISDTTIASWNADDLTVISSLRFREANSLYYVGHDSVSASDQRGV